MSEEDFLKKYNLKRAENTEDYQIDNETIIKELQERIDKAIELLELTETRKKVCTDFVNVGRKRYDEILNILKGGNNE